MPNIDQCYETLGLEFGASYEEVKNAYNKLVRIHHPDVGGDVDKMAEINHAFKYLNDNVDFTSIKNNLNNNDNNSQYNNNLTLDDALNILALSKNNLTPNKIEKRYKSLLRTSFSSYRTNEINAAYDILKKKYCNSNDSQYDNCIDNLTLDDALNIFSLSKNNLMPNKIEKRYKSLLRTSFSSYRTNEINAAYDILKKKYCNSNDSQYDNSIDNLTLDDALKLFNLDKNTTFNKIENRLLEILNNAHDNLYVDEKFFSNINKAFGILKNQYDNSDTNSFNHDLDLYEALNIFSFKNNNFDLDLLERRYKVLMKYSKNTEESHKIKNAYLLLKKNIS